MLEVAKAGARPQFLLQFFAGNQLPWFLQQGKQDLDGLAGKLQTRAVLAQFARIRRDLEGTKPNGNRSCTRFRHTRPHNWQECTPFCRIRLSENGGSEQLLSVTESSAYRFTWCYLFLISFAWR